MNAKHNAAVLTALAVIVWSSPAQAQFTGNNQTNNISNVVSSWTGVYYAGSNCVFDALLIQKGSVLSNGAGVIGVTIVAGINSTCKPEYDLLCRRLGSQTEKRS